MMAVVNTSEMSVNSYETIHRNIAEEDIVIVVAVRTWKKSRKIGTIYTRLTTW
jgi:hypothetical protein